MRRLEVIKFARANGYAWAKKTRINYKGYEVWKRVFSFNPKYIGKTATVGMPLVILVSRDEIRMCDADESLEILDMM